MKQIFSAVATLLFAVITLASCANSEANKAVKIINDTTEQINALEEGSGAEIDDAIADMFNKLEAYKDSDYELTSSDRKKLAEAIVTLNIATYHVAFGMPEPSKEEKDAQIESCAKELTEYKTLGDMMRR